MTTSSTSLPSTTLYYCQGSSDKIYQVGIERSAAGFRVNFAFGRRGSTLQAGSKTPRPVELAAARKIYEKLVAEKNAKGYTPGAQGTPYQDTPHQDRSTGIAPQLLNAIDEAQADQLIADPAWLAQEKLDGKRILLRRSADKITGINRKGLIVALPQPIVDCARQFAGMHWLMDGECIGERLIAFDLLDYASADCRQETYFQRLKRLNAMATVDSSHPINFLRSASTQVDKRTMIAELRERRAEGIVFKRQEAPYTPGRPASGGDQLKFKFTATASCLAGPANDNKRSVRLELWNGNAWIAAGNVTIPGKQDIPNEGSVIEVRYLYAYPGGSLFQPVYLGIRDDQDVTDCTLLQLRYKPQEGDEG